MSTHNFMIMSTMTKHSFPTEKWLYLHSRLEVGKTVLNKKKECVCHVSKTQIIKSKFLTNYYAELGLKTLRSCLFVFFYVRNLFVPSRQSWAALTTWSFCRPMALRSSITCHIGAAEASTLSKGFINININKEVLERGSSEYYFRIHFERGPPCYVGLIDVSVVRTLES